MTRRIRVLVVDDSALVRQMLTAGLAADPELEVVGSAGDAFSARDKIVQLAPDVMTLDVEMPRMDGIDFLRRLMAQRPIPVVMVSALTERGAKITLDALAAGAVDFVEKPKADMAKGLQAMMLELRAKVRAAAVANVARLVTPPRAAAPISTLPTALARSTDKVIAIGASTGGTEAIRAIIERLPRTTPGVVVVQHMPARFTTLFAERLSALSPMEVIEAKHGDRIIDGRVLIAPGGLHTRIVRSGGYYSVQVTPGANVNGHAPSVDVLMQSVAVHAGSNAVGVLLTGMGSDGADGLLAMRKSGARTIAQDEQTCVVFGMPKVAIEKGGVDRVLPLGDIAAAILTEVSR